MRCGDKKDYVLNVHLGGPKLKHMTHTERVEQYKLSILHDQLGLDSFPIQMLLIC